MPTTTKSEPLVKNRFSPSQKCVSPRGIEPAQQQFKQDADLNSIMAKFQKTQSLEHVKLYQTEYGFASPTDYHQSLNTVIKAEQMFAELPSTVRNRFANKPAAFLEFVQNPENKAEAQELGLTVVPPQGAASAPEPSGTAKPSEGGGSPSGMTDTPPESAGATPA